VLAVDESRADEDAASVFFALSPLLQAASRVNAMTAHILEFRPSSSWNMEILRSRRTGTAKIITAAPLVGA